MATFLRSLPALVLSVVPAAQAAGDYVGVLRPTPNAVAIPQGVFYWPVSGHFTPGVRPGLESAAEGQKLKLGFRYSKYLSVETGYADAGLASVRTPLSAITARGRGFSMDTVGTLPLWTHGTLYGRLGAWRSAGGASLLAGGEGLQRPGAGLRYGLGFKYDLTRHVGLQAELERFSPLDQWGPRESDTDQFTFGVRWRF